MSLTDYFKNISSKSKIRVLKSRFSNNTKLMGCLPKNVFIDFLNSSGSYFEIDESVLIDVENEYKKRLRQDKIYNTIAALNNKGISFEKLGNIEKAIVEYEKCMNLMIENFDILTQLAWHSPNRLRILYKKLKHPNEKQFLIEFTSFCKSRNIEYPAVFDNQLNKLKI